MMQMKCEMGSGLDVAVIWEGFIAWLTNEVSYEFYSTIL
jgi:hypothetical protein